MRPAARPVSQMSLGAARVRERCSARCWRHQPIRPELAPEVQGSTYNLIRTEECTQREKRKVTLNVADPS